MSVLLLGLLLLLLAQNRSHAAAASIALEGLDPVFRTQVAPGGTVTFRATVTPADAALQWYFNDLPISGATATTLTLAPVSAVHAGNYRLKVLDSTGTATWSQTLPLNVLPSPASPVDTRFSASFAADVTRATPVIALADGGVIVTETLAAGGTRYAHLHADGTHDLAFNLPDTSGTLLAADATTVLSTVAPYRRAYDGSSAAIILPTGFDATSPLAAALIQPDGRFFLAQGATLARFTAAGTVDTTFTAPVSANTIQWLRLDPQGRLVVARALPNNAGTALQRLTATGAVDASFVPPTELPYASARVFTSCNDLFPLPAGGYIAELLGTSFVRLNDDGSLDPAWVLFQTTSFYPRSFEFQTAVTSDGSLFVTSILAGGTFRRYSLSPHFYSDSTTFYPSFPSDAAGKPFAYSGPLLPTVDGHVFVSGDFSRWDRHATRFVAKLDATTTATLPPSVAISVRRGSDTVYDPRFHAGESIALVASVIGEGATGVEWLALDGQPIPAPSSSIISIASFSPAHAGRYQLRVTTAAGVILSQVLNLGFDADPIYLANISGRAPTGRGEATPIAGFVVPVASRVLLRGIGPTLQSYGLAHPLAEPILQLQAAESSLATRFDASGNTPEASALALTLGASPLTADSLDVTAAVDAPAGPATVTLAGRTSTDLGIGLAEVYATSPAAAPVNLSFRARTAPGDDTAIAGFVLADPGAASPHARVLLRAVGPTLATKGIAAPLADPILTVYDASGHVVAQNDNWPSHLTAEVTPFDAATAVVGAFQLLPDSKDAALLLDLPAGAYTMHATGGTGIVLLEIYLVP